MNNGKNKAIFFDRDGTIIKDKNYLKSPSEIEYLPGFFEAYEKLSKMGFLTFLITNQSGVARGFFTMEDVNLVHQQIQNDLISRGLKPFDAIKVCPHVPENKCDCRKPQIKMAQELISSFSINVDQSYFLGDKDIDLEMAKNAHISGILILSHQSPKNHQFPNVFSNIKDFAQTLSDE